MAKVGEEDPRPNLGKGQGKGQVRRGAREDRRRARSQEKRKQWHKARAPLGHPGGKGPAWEGRHRRTGTSLGLAAVVMPGVCSSGVGGWLRRVGCSGNQKTHWRTWEALRKQGFTNSQGLCTQSSFPAAFFLRFLLPVHAPGGRRPGDLCLPLLCLQFPAG